MEVQLRSMVVVLVSSFVLDKLSQVRHTLHLKHIYPRSTPKHCLGHGSLDRFSATTDHFSTTFSAVVWIVASKALSFIHVSLIGQFLPFAQRTLWSFHLLFRDGCCR